MSPLARLFLGTVALVAVYFVVPVELTENVVLRAAISVSLLALVTWLIYWEVRRQVRQAASPLWGLGLAMVAGVMVFALTDYVIARNYPGQFAGLVTRLDGLYFALTTLATVGYGDVHAAGQLARGVVSVQQVFNIVVVTTAASVLVGELRTRAAARSQPPGPAAGPQPGPAAGPQPPGPAAGPQPPGPAAGPQPPGPAAGPRPPGNQSPGR